MPDINKYCYLTIAHVGVVFLLLILRLIYLWRMNRLSYELGYHAIFLLTTFIWLWDRCKYCPACWGFSWLCEMVKHITTGWQ